MLVDRPDFREWLAKYDAQGFRLARVGKRTVPMESQTDCGACGGPLGDTPSQLREDCLVCLAERFGGDLVEETLTKLFLGGMVKAAMDCEEISDDLVPSVVQDAIREYEHESGQSWGRGLARAREAVTR